jgi:hypothetical protein
MAFVAMAFEDFASPTRRSQPKHEPFDEQRQHHVSFAPDTERDGPFRRLEGDSVRRSLASANRRVSHAGVIAWDTCRIIGGHSAACRSFRRSRDCSLAASLGASRAPLRACQDRPSAVLYRAQL